MTKLVTCDTQVASFTAALATATPAQLQALAAALSTTGVVTSATLLSSLTAALYAGSTAQLTALAAALTLSGVGTGAFIGQSVGTVLPNGVETTLATWTAPKTGAIAAAFNFYGRTDATVQQLYTVAKIYRGATSIAVGTESSGDVDLEIRDVGATCSVMFLPVTAGDVITAKAFVGCSPATSSTVLPISGAALTLHYVQVS